MLIAGKHISTLLYSSHWETRTISYELMIAASAEFES